MRVWNSHSLRMEVNALTGVHLLRAHFYKGKPTVLLKLAHQADVLMVMGELYHGDSLFLLEM